MTLSSASIFNSYNTNQNATTSGNCISRIIRRILCITNLPKSPFDHVKEEEEANDPLLECGSATPSLMARLMGLDSLPPTGSDQSTPSTNHVESSRKSRSPRTKKIIPTYREFEDDNFFILSFDRGENLDITGERWKSCSRSSGKKKKYRRRRDVNKENLHRISVLEGESKTSGVRKKDSSNVLRPLQDSTQNSNGASRKQKKGKQHGTKVDELKADPVSENSSPNSVLEYLEFPPDKEAANPGNDSRLGNSKSRRTLSDELVNVVNSSSNDRKSMKDDCVEEEKNTRLKDSKEYYVGKLDEISKMAANEVVKSCWLNNETLKNHHFQVIGRELSFEIFDQLLHELLI